MGSRKQAAAFRTMLTCAAVALCSLASGCDGGGAPAINDASPPATTATQTPTQAGSPTSTDGVQESPDGAAAGQGGATQAEGSEPGRGELTDDFEGTAGIAEKKREGVAPVILRAVRAAGHLNYDRVVFEFEGTTLPGYHVEYVDRPVRQCGSGEAVPLAGHGWLRVSLTPAYAHTEAGEPTVKDRSLRPNLQNLKELKATCDFEAHVEWVLGLASPNRYRVLELSNPTRLVVDVRK